MVALETTLVAHGFPHPLGVQTALASEAAVREGGAIPATIALLDGELRVGLRQADLERIALGDARKVGAARPRRRRSSTRASGATTVAGTLATARLCGIQFMATGGLGGVHRGAEHTWDVSADLTELAQHAPLASSRSGVEVAARRAARRSRCWRRSGMPVVGYGTSTLPAVPAASRRTDVPARVDTARSRRPRSAASTGSSAPTAVLVANPPPAELGAAGARRPRR